MRSMLDELVNILFGLRNHVFHETCDDPLRLSRLTVQHSGADGKRERRPLGEAIRPGLALL